MRRVPDAHGAVGAGRTEPVAIGAESQCVNRAFVPAQFILEPASAPGPHADDAVHPSTASNALSGLKAMLVIGVSGGAAAMTRRGLPVAHSRTGPCNRTSPKPVPGHRAKNECGRLHPRARASQISKRRSRLPKARFTHCPAVASQWPSALRSRSITLSRSGTTTVRRCRPEGSSQRVTSPSPPPAASSLPSPDRAMASTRRLWVKTSETWPLAKSHNRTGGCRSSREAAARNARRA